MNNEAGIVSQLKSRLEGGTAWGKHIEEFVASYGNLNPPDVAELQTEHLWKLWTASKFAETGTPGLPTPTEEQWEGLREMTRLLCDRSKLVGERFEAAKVACEKTFNADQLQLPLILRTLLILEGGRCGTVATKSYTNLLLKWAGKSELNYRNSASITSALTHVRELMDHWAAKAGATSSGERARIPWYLCEIIRDGSTDKFNHWIFQGNPDEFDVDAYLTEQDNILWSVRQHREKIHTGDRVLIWRSGKIGGVVAVCTVESDPALQPDDAPDKWKKTGGEPDLRCRLKIEARSVDRPIPRDAIKAELPNLSIIKAPQGTNFPISAADYAAILALRTSSPPASSFRELLRRYHEEQIIFASSAQKQRYAIAAHDTDGVNVERLDAKEPQRVTFAQAEKLIQQLREQRELEFASLNHTAAVRNTVLQAEPLALTADQKLIVFLPDHTSRLQNFREVLVGMKRENRFYKPAMLLCVLDGIDDGSLAENRIPFDWIAPRFVALLQSLGQDNATEQQAAQPFYHLSSDLFWLHAAQNRNDLMENGSDGPYAARKKIKYALLKDTYWNLLQDPVSRRAVRHQLEILIMPTPDQLLSAAEAAIKATGFQHAPGLVGRFLSALAAKPFVILTGNSGTGKTLLAKLLVEWLSHGSNAPSADPFVPGSAIESDRIKYYVRSADVLAVEFWNHEKEEQATKVMLPRQMIREWADTIVSSHFDANTPARTIREAVAPGSKFSSQLHSFETHLKAAALALLLEKSQQRNAPIPSSLSYAIVPVGADWTDNRNVVGFVNHLRKDGQQKPIYQSTPVLDLLLRAADDPFRPYFLILDEMNLSHVERYFADFLSAMESKKPIPLHQERHSLRTPSGALVPDAVSFPDNFFVIGTVNVDETTYMFSPKVLDRANVIEFRVGAEQAKAFLLQTEKHVATTTPALGAPIGFLTLSRRARGLAEPALASPSGPVLTECRKSLQDLFELLHGARLEFAFRTITEITRYLHVSFESAPEKSAWSWDSSMDAQVLQKILPKLHGSRRRLEAILIALATYCEKRDVEASQKLLQREAELNGYPSANPPSLVAFPLSRTKLLEMIEAVRRDQFVSFIQ